MGLESRKGIRIQILSDGLKSCADGVGGVGGRGKGRGTPKACRKAMATTHAWWEKSDSAQYNIISFPALKTLVSKTGILGAGVPHSPS